MQFLKTIKGEKCYIYSPDANPTFLITHFYFFLLLVMVMVFCFRFFFKKKKRKNN